MSRQPFAGWPVPAQQPSPEIAARGAARARAVLATKGVMPSPRLTLDGDYDTPLSQCERRHLVHIFHALILPSCRFCVGAAVVTALTAVSIRANLAS